MAPPSTLTTSSGSPRSRSDRKRDGGERLVDLDALDVADRPPGSIERLATAGTGPMPNMPGSTAPTP